MATPHVSGVAALLMAANNALTPQQVITCIINGADPITTDQPIGGKRLNALKAFNQCGFSIPTGVPATPTPTPVSTATQLQFNSVKLHGIGNSGDNTNPNSTGNMNPLHTSRIITVTLADKNNIALPQKQGVITYHASSGDFQGVVSLGSVQSGVYTVRVQIPGYLSKTINSIVTLTNGQSTIIIPFSLTTGDASGDGIISALDYNFIFDCISDLSPARNCADSAKKQAADLNDDGKVDQFDYNLLMRELLVQNGQ
jgi:hypothetical protein